jgi:hypothetical protein
MSYVLLNSKKEGNYIAAFEKIKIFCDITSKYIICDFELGLIGAIKTSLLYSKTYVCSFHFLQAICRKMQELGLSSDYAKSIDSRKNFKLF